MSKCQGCGQEGPHAVVYGACECRVWPLAAPETFFQMGRCGFCGTRPKPPFIEEPPT